MRCRLNHSSAPSVSDTMRDLMFSKFQAPVVCQRGSPAPQLLQQWWRVTALWLSRDGADTIIMMAVCVASERPGAGAGAGAMHNTANAHESARRHRVRVGALAGAETSSRRTGSCRDSDSQQRRGHTRNLHGGSARSSSGYAWSQSISCAAFCTAPHGSAATVAAACSNNITGSATAAERTSSLRPSSGRRRR